MARKRMISPEFWTDEKLGLMPVEARLLFMGLISNADDKGRLPGNTLLVKAMVFPYDNFTAAKIDEWLKLLCQQKIVTRYTVDSQAFIQITNFLKHQTINRPTPSKIPAFANTELPPTEPSLNTHGESSDDSLPKEENRKEVNIICVEVIAHLNKKSGTSYKPTTEITKKHINARYEEGYRLSDFITVIDKKVTEWKGTDQEKYLRPETLFGTKFEGYLNQKSTKPQTPEPKSTVPLGSEVLEWS